MDVINIENYQMNKSMCTIQWHSLYIWKTYDEKREKLLTVLDSHPSMKHYNITHL